MKNIRAQSSSSLLILAAFLPALFSCERIQPVRTLPNWVRSVYVPMIQNRSSEPGLEEVATRLTQEEFLADGRLRIAPKASADLQVVAKIVSYHTRVRRVRQERIPLNDEIELVTVLMLYDASADPFDPQAPPIAYLGEIATRTTRIADVRSTSVVIEPDAKQLALAQLARQIVDRTINGFPTGLKDTPSGTNLPKETSPQYGTQGNIFRNHGSN